MAVQVYKERKALVLQWDKGAYDGPVTLENVNDADISDISTTELVSNPGFAAVTFPSDYAGTFTVNVKDADGNTLDSGDVQVD